MNGRSVWRDPWRHHAWSIARLEKGGSPRERPKTYRIAFKTTDLPKVYHHLPGQRPRRLQVDTKIYHRDGPTVGHTHGQDDK